LDPRDDSGWAAWLGDLSSDLSEKPYEVLERTAFMVIDRAELSRGDTVADLGAGTGLLTLKAARAVGPAGTVLAVDSSQACLDELSERAREAGIGNVRPVRASLDSLPIDSSSCDAAVCRSALVYLDDPGAALTEVRRMLRPGGRFSFFEPLASEMEWSASDEDRLDKDFFEIERTLRKKRASYPMNRVALRKAFERAGLKSEGSLPMHFPIRMEGRPEDEVAREYLWDLPGELAAFEILKDDISEERLLRAAASFAREASAGTVRGMLPCLLVWGISPSEGEK
jgi:ubiquinone/menaquinone biosynthesis C-methylase UbiE